jgi:hypothetical protein
VRSEFELNGYGFSPFQATTLRTVMMDPGAFLLLLAGSAEDLAAGSHQDSSIADGYRAKGLSIINKRMKEPHQSVSNGTITACAVLAGAEVSEILSVLQDLTPLQAYQGDSGNV